MDRNRKNEKKQKNWILPLAIFGVTFLGPILDGGGAVAVLFILLLIMAAGVFALVFFLTKAKMNGTKQHSHDRIDHSSDLKIDTKTGKVVGTIQKAGSHSQREHWKQQLDSLLENGTIDKNEYRAMMDRKF